jgi:nickel transport protein
VKGLFVCWFLTAALFLPAAVFAHGVEITDVTGQAGVRTLRFMYSTGEPMFFAVVKVYPPSAPEAAVQESMTDRDGYFSFVPFEDGLWRLTVEDGMGHRGETGVAAAGGAEAAEAARNTAPSGKLPTPAAAVLGLSLIFNVFAFWYAAGRKLKKQGAVHAHQ